MSSLHSLKRCLIAILRGIRHDEVDGVVTELLQAGFEAIEIPLNSPEPFRSIERAVKIAPSHCLIGAGTVLTRDEVKTLSHLGARLIVSPNMDIDVIGAARAAGMVSMPGVFTATEAFSAIKAGASGLKFFPASALGPSGLAALGAVLPKDVTIGAVGGVAPENFAEYGRHGIRCFGLGSNLYKPGDKPSDTRGKAVTAIEAYDRAFGAEARST
jgi:2-dehydro-3-deoxyphosphogalactonate aldolase